MESTHRVVPGDSRTLSSIDDDSVELVVTSPPYPMIEMWDELFIELNPGIGPAISSGDGRRAFEQMHQQLDEVWNELQRVVVEGGVVCINVGDATRKVDSSFRVYQNHSRIIDSFEELGFEPLPEILWRKPVNSAAKFMGSGMLPPNAYVTLEHEYILIFRNGKSRREFKVGSERRYNSAYFWEERNQWFSDVWMDIRGELQALDHGELRERSAAYPFEIPYRLINMYSIYQDTVLDPFWGTGTTSLAAMTAGRNSIGYEIQDEFIKVFNDRVSDVVRFSENVVHKRLKDHIEFIEERIGSGEDVKYEADKYQFPVTTKQEKGIQFYTVENIEKTEGGYEAVHKPVDSDVIASDVSSKSEELTSLSEF